jgi:hypothetical protein
MCRQSRRRSETSSAPQNPRFLASDLPLLPVGIERGARPLSTMHAAYEFAARHPEVMKFVPCFCGCEQGRPQGQPRLFRLGDATRRGK